MVGLTGDADIFVGLAADGDEPAAAACIVRGGHEGRLMSRRKQSRTGGASGDSVGAGCA